MLAFLVAATALVVLDAVLETVLNLILPQRYADAMLTGMGRQLMSTSLVAWGLGRFIAGASLGVALLVGLVPFGMVVGMRAWLNQNADVVGLGTMALVPPHLAAAGVAWMAGAALSYRAGLASRHRQQASAG